MVGLSGLEPPTSRLSGVRSNQLSYRPSIIFESSVFAFLFLPEHSDEHSKLNAICHRYSAFIFYEDVPNNNP